MTILELANEHMPLDLARIVTDYAIRKDWRPAMDEVVATMNSRGPVSATMMDFQRTKRWMNIVWNWEAYNFDSECERLCSYSHFRDAPNRFDIDQQLVKVYVHILNDPKINPVERMGGWLPISAYDEGFINPNFCTDTISRFRQRAMNAQLFGYNIPFDFPL